MTFKKVHKRFAPHGSDHQHEARAIGFVPEDPAFGNPSNRPTSGTGTQTASSTASVSHSTTSSSVSSASSSSEVSSSSESSSAAESSSSSETTSASVVAPPVDHQPTAPPPDTKNDVPQYEPSTTRTTPLPSANINNRSSTSSSATSSSTATLPADGDSNVSSIAGMAAAGIAAVAVIAVLLVWFIRRRQRAKENAEVDAAAVFSRDSFMRHSTMIPDEPKTGGLPPPRRGPEMIDRSYNSTPVSTYGGAGYAQSDFGYATQPSFQPGSVVFTPTSPNTSFGPGGAPATPLPSTPGFTPGFEGQVSQANGYTELTRGSPMSPPPFTPVHQQTFDEIPRQMTPNIPPVVPAAMISMPSSPAPADPYGRVPAYPELSPVNAAQRGQVTEIRPSAYEAQATSAQYGFAGARPDQKANGGAPPNTVYDEDDAYGGI